MNNSLAEVHPELVSEWSDRNYPILPTQVPVFANRKAWWKCKYCGKEWNTLISIRSGGSKCPYCSGYIFLKGFIINVLSENSGNSFWDCPNFLYKYKMKKQRVIFNKIY